LFQLTPPFDGTRLQIQIQITLAVHGCCSCRVGAQLDCFRQNGFVCLHQVFAGEHLARMQGAWRRAVSRASPASAAAAATPALEGQIALQDLFAEALQQQEGEGEQDDAAAGAAATAGGDGGGDPVLLDALDAPAVLQLLEAIIGPGRFSSHDVALAGVTAHAATSTNQGSLACRWDRNIDRPADSWPHPTHRVVLVEISLSGDENGPLRAIVPGSHRLKQRPEEVYGERLLRVAAADDADSDDSTTIPNQTELKGSPGSVLVYDAAVWHKQTAAIAGGTRGAAGDRLVLGYHSQRANIPTGPRFSEAMIAEMEASGVMRDSLRGVLGLTPDYA
jgi:hypothetical protein